MINYKQLGLVHLAAKQVGLIDEDGDERYRLLLINVGGVNSAALLNNVSFEDVMAVMEDMGFSLNRHRHVERASFTGSGGAMPPPCTYWRDKVGERGRFANARMVFKIKELAAESRYDLPAMCLRMSNARTGRVEQLTPKEAWNLIEAFKASNQRNGVPC